MSKLRFRISMSLDGFVAGPHQSVDNPLGVGGMRLHEWVFPLRAWRAMHGEPGGEVDESNQVVEESLANIGATVMGRNMFGGHPGPWKRDTPWTGWWGNDPPYHHPVFVLTHHPREPLRLEGGTTFTFVTDGIESALQQARSAARGKDVSLAGGVRTFARQKNDYHLAPFFSGADGRVVITHDELDIAAHAELQTGLMDYGWLGDSFAYIEIAHWSPDQIGRASC